MIVSNTSPLRYLIAVGQAGLIQKLFEEVLIPPAVYAELRILGPRRCTPVG